MNPGSTRTRRGLTPLFLLALLLFGTVGAVLAQEGRAPRRAPPASERVLWFFFSPAEKPLAGEIRALAKVLGRHPEVALRPVFLTDDWGVLKKPAQDFAETIQELRSLGGQGAGIRVWDDEGLALARELGIRSLPAYAVLDATDPSGGRRALVSVGFGTKIEELLRCK